MYREIIPITLLGLLAGCASVPNVALTAAARSDMLGKDVTIDVNPQPDFLALSSARASLGPFGVMASAKIGNKLVKDDAIADPATMISQTLAQAVAIKLGAHMVIGDRTPVTDSHPTALIKVHHEAPLLLDVTTLGWGMKYFATDWIHYRAVYSAQLRIIDTSNGKVLVSGKCDEEPDQDVGLPTYDDAIANNGAILKKLLQVDVDKCMGDLEAQTLGLIMHG